MCFSVSFQTKSLEICLKHYTHLFFLKSPLKDEQKHPPRSLPAHPVVIEHIHMFAYLYRKLYTEVLQPDDDLFTRCRKAVITCALVFGIINSFANGAASVTYSDWSVLAVVNTVMIYIQSAIYIASWIYAKITRTSPDWLVNLVMEVSLFQLLVCSFVSPDWGWHAVCLSLAIGSIIIGTSHMNIQVAVSAFLFALNAYDTLGYPSILLPGNYEGSILIRQIVNGVVASLALWAVYVMMKQFVLLIAKSAASVQMAKEVSTMLAAYDTAGAVG